MKTITSIILVFSFILNVQSQTQILNDLIIPIELGCVHYKGESVIVKSQEEYESIYNPVIYIPECDNYSFPEIDFENFVLVGIQISYGGKIINISEDLIKDEVYLNYQYSVKLYTTGNNRRNNLIVLWRLVQKNPTENYEYEVKILKYKQ